MQQISDTVTRITGRAYVGEVNTKGKVPTAGGNCLGLVFDVNPVLLNDRVAVVASTYEKYVYHGVKFTYVPQCSTATQGSVGLCFERDPLMYSANPIGTQFLSEVMSYEHAVLTPCWTGTQTSYARDPQELKTWYMGATDATLTTRETSQGNLLVYLSNVLPNVGLGFIVMDYVLDLVSPNLLPNKQDVTNIKSAPSQWIDYNGSQGGVNSTQMNYSGPQVPVGTGGSSRYALLSPEASWSTTLPVLQKPGCVGEYHIGGTMASDPTVRVVNGTFVDSANAPVTLKPGQKVYFCTHAYNAGVGGDDFLMLSLHTTLSSARAAQSSTMTSLSYTAQLTLADQLYPTSNPIQLGGWLRLITPSTAGVVNSA